MEYIMVEHVKVLVIDDEQAVRRFLRTSLSAHGYDVVETTSGEDGILASINSQPDIIILDLGLPDMDGITVTRRIREWSQTPIVILTVQDQDAVKIAALDAGADDYLTKPFSLGELMARMRVALRHQQPSVEPIFETGSLHVDMAARVVEVDGKEIQLTPTEYDLLRVLVKFAGKVITHQQLLREIRGVGYQTETHLLRVHMSNLRAKIESDPTNPQYIITEAGVGYRLRIKD
jgi:two-component system, OmpR family, KDP operon response regulator KdpE